jgi:hypothetical protein
MRKRKRLDICIDSEIAVQMREASLKRYGNSRSLSRLIEDLFKYFREPSFIDELKAKRDRYDEWCMKTAEIEKIGISSFKCNTCYATFSTRPTDGNCCPACCSSDLELTHNKGEESEQFEKQWYRPLRTT